VSTPSLLNANHLYLRSCFQVSAGDLGNTKRVESVGGEVAPPCAGSRDQDGGCGTTYTD